jgi:hypothetical protein
MCADTALCLLTEERYCIARPAEFEGADMLQILALEEEAPPGHRIECGRSQNWSVGDDSIDASSRSANILKIDRSHVPHPFQAP